MSRRCRIATSLIATATLTSVMATTNAPASYSETPSPTPATPSSSTTPRATVPATSPTPPTVSPSTDTSDAPGSVIRAIKDLLQRLIDDLAGEDASYGGTAPAPLGTPTPHNQRSATTQPTTPTHASTQATPHTSPTPQIEASAQPHNGAAGSQATALLGPTRSGLPWHSGAWVGGRFTPEGIGAFGQMRGRAADLTTTYGPTESPTKMVNDDWSITTWNGFEGKLNYGLPLAFKDGTTMAQVASGAADNAYRQVAQNLVKQGRGDSVIRAGWEMNYKAWPWGTDSANVGDFKAAFRRAAVAMKAEAPQLQFEFGVSCGDTLGGASDRLAPLTQGYPGDDVVDIVGCDTYDRWSAHASDENSWQANVLRGPQGPGIQDVVDFARAHHKGAGFGEWGLAKPDGNNHAGGDNAFYITKMGEFFWDNSDVVAFECYFDERDPEMGNSLVENQMPQARQAYNNTWGKQ